MKETHILENYMIHRKRLKPDDLICTEGAVMRWRQSSYKEKRKHL